MSRAKDEAFNRILQKVEASAIATQPQIAPLIEIVRQSYNHREYLYDVARELTSSKSMGRKLSTISDRTVQELEREAMGRLVGRGVKMVSSRLREIGIFARPFGYKGPVLDEKQSSVLQTFFEGTLNQLLQEE